MLCLDESSPVIMALSLAGAVLLIVGGSLWGSGDASGQFAQTAAGVGLFCASLGLLALAGFGCWCNKCFCTPERKSRLAERFYGRSAAGAAGGRSKPAAASGEAEAEDAEDAADCGSLGSSFRSFRSSRRSVRRGASARRDRVQPVLEGNGVNGTADTVDKHRPAIREQPNGTGEAVIKQDTGDLERGEAHAAATAAPVQQTSIDDVSEVASSTYSAYHGEGDSNNAEDQTAARHEHEDGSIYVSC